MELVYLWVEEYKNIHRQGFNFSSQFTCKFKDEYDADGKLKDNCELVICDKEKKECEDNNYIKNFFGDNINVTAIIGKNGSGKSSIIDMILDSIEDDLSTHYIIVFKCSGQKLNYLSNFNLRTIINQNDDWKNRRNVFAYNNGTHEHYAFRYYKIVEIDKNSIANILSVEYGKSSTSFAISTFMYLPVQIEITLKDTDELLEANINFFPPRDRDDIRDIFNSIKNRYHQFLFINYGRKVGIKFKKEVLKDKIKLKEELTKVVSEKDFNKFFIPLTSKQIFNIADLRTEEKDIYIGENGYFHFFNFDMIDEKERRFNNLSHGEQMIFGQLLNIYFFSNGSSDNLFFLFDEPETALHPNWQKKYLNEVITLFKKLNKEYQFVFTSHSPFLISDIPKQHIIFLDTYKNGENIYQNEGNCKIVDGLDKETFGANIHTLLSDCFFMEGGLMGEFAKQKINKIIRFLNGENKFIDFPIENIKKIIEVIGEPFLKDKLLRMYDGKYPKTKDEAIAELEDKLERLKNG